MKKILYHILALLIIFIAIGSTEEEPIANNNNQKEVLQILNNKILSAQEK